MHRKLGYGTSALVFLLLLIFFKIPLSTDDFTWGLILKQKGHLFFLDDYFFRLPLWRLLLSILFPLYLHLPFLGKLVSWGAGLLGVYLILRWFLAKYRMPQAIWPLITLLVFFAPGQYEITYLFYCLPYCFGLLFAGLGFSASRAGHKFLAGLFYLLSFLTLESFIALVILAECAARIEDLASWKSIKKIARSLLPSLILYAGFRLLLQIYHPFAYRIEMHWSWPQLKGLFLQCFFIHFYKTNALLSSGQLLLYVFLGFQLYKKRNPSRPFRESLKNSVVLLMTMIVSSLYYVVLTYSANRALAGQICFWWGLYLVLGAIFLFSWRGAVWKKAVLALLLVSVQIANVGLIHRTKTFNFNLIQKNIGLVKERLSQGETPVAVDLNKFLAGFRRDWILAHTDDAKSLFKLYLTPQEFSRLAFTP